MFARVVGEAPGGLGERGAANRGAVVLVHHDPDASGGVVADEPCPADGPVVVAGDEAHGKGQAGRHDPRGHAKGAQAWVHSCVLVCSVDVPGPLLASSNMRLRLLCPSGSTIKADAKLPMKPMQNILLVNM